MGHEFNELLAALNDAVATGDHALAAQIQRKLANFE